MRGDPRLRPAGWYTQRIVRRSLAELMAVDDPAWLLVQGWIAAARNRVEVLPPAASRGDNLAGLQVTLRSPLGAVAYETGGLLVDHGWLRILGSGHPRLPRAIVDWNVERNVVGEPPPFVLVADDVVGGCFALDGGGWGAPGHVHYFAPDALAWEDLGHGYSGFLRWAFEGNLAGFYADYRWDGWEREVEAAPGDEGYSIVPLPFTEGPPLAQRDRRLVPARELYELYQDMAR